MDLQTETTAVAPASGAATQQHRMILSCRPANHNHPTKYGQPFPVQVLPLLQEISAQEQLSVYEEWHLIPQQNQDSEDWGGRTGSEGFFKVVSSYGEPQSHSLALAVEIKDEDEGNAEEEEVEITFVSATAASGDSTTLESPSSSKTVVVVPISPDKSHEDDKFLWILEHQLDGGIQLRSMATNSCLTVGANSSSNENSENNYNHGSGSSGWTVYCPSFVPNEYDPPHEAEDEKSPAPSGRTTERPPTEEATRASTTATVTTPNDEYSSYCCDGWQLDFLSGELCYIQLGPNHNPGLLMCDNFGTLKVTNVFGGWEVWRFLETTAVCHDDYGAASGAPPLHQLLPDKETHQQEDATVTTTTPPTASRDFIRIASWTHSDLFLACNSQGKVTTTTDLWSPDTLWHVERAGLDGVSIQSVPHGRFLTLSNRGTISALTAFPGRLATFRLTAAHRQRYYLSNMARDKRISAIRSNILSRKTTLKATPNRRDCEVWHIRQLENGFIMLVSDKWEGHTLKCDGQRLTVVSENEQENANSADVSAKEDLFFSANDNRASIWRVIPSPVGNGVCILSAMDHGLALSCDEQGELVLVDRHDFSECWNLEPSMPFSLERWQIKLMVGGVVGAALLGPALAMGAAAIMGAEGVAVAGTAASGGGVAAAAVAGAETVAAASAASAAGGAALAGSTAAAAAAATVETAAAATTAGVAFGLAETTVAAATGAAIGVSATSVVVTSSKRTCKQGTSFASTASQNRPFCDWSRW